MRFIALAISTCIHNFNITISSNDTDYHNTCSFDKKFLLPPILSMVMSMLKCCANKLCKSIYPLTLEVLKSYRQNFVQ